MLDESKRRRALTPAIKDARSALDVVRPLHKQLDSWQGLAVQFNAMASRNAAAYAPDVIPKAASLLDEIERASASLDAAVTLLPPNVAGHSRIADTRLALDRVSSSLRVTLRLATGGAERGSFPAL